MARSRRRRLRGPRYARAAQDAWDRAIDSWEDFQEAGKDFSRDQVHGPALLRALGPLRGLRVLDLGCGQGRFTRELARRGAVAVGIDWSRRMIEVARRHEKEQPLGIAYLRGDARAVGRRSSLGQFDLVTGCMSFMDMPEIDRVLRGARSRLRAGGRLVFSVSHPLNTAALGWERSAGHDRGAMRIDRYFEERPGKLEWRMGRLKRPFDTVYWHRTLEGWFASLARAGFEVQGLWEPHPTATQARRFPALRGSGKVPFYLVISCRLSAGAAA